MQMVFRHNAAVVAAEQARYGTDAPDPELEELERIESEGDEPHRRKKAKVLRFRPGGAELAVLPAFQFPSWYNELPRAGTRALVLPAFQFPSWYNRGLHLGHGRMSCRPSNSPVGTILVHKPYPFG